MAAPKNNTYWLKRSKHGRDKIFTDSKILLAAAYEYFKWNASNPWYKNEAIKSGDNAGTILNIPTERPLTIEGLTQHLGVTRKYLDNFEKRLLPDDEDFLPVIHLIREIIRRHQLEGAMLNFFNGNIVSRLIGLVDKSALDLNLDTMSEDQLDQIIQRILNKQ